MHGKRFLGFFALVSLGVSCTAPNLGYNPFDLGVDAPRADGPALDGISPPIEQGLSEAAAPREASSIEVGVHDAASDRRPPDTFPTVDSLAWPDAVPWKCTTDSQCSDSRSCTMDKCDTTTHECTNTLISGYCLIGTSCLKSGDLNTSNSCEACDPTQSTSAWTTRKDGVTCASDGLACTSDVCKSGTCDHPPSTGNCLISGTCYTSYQVNSSDACQACLPSTSQTAWSSLPDKTVCTSDSIGCTVDVCLSGTCTHNVASGSCLISGTTCILDGETHLTDPCKECITSVSQSAYTFATGKACVTTTGLGSMCVANACKGWVESTFEPTGQVHSASLLSVDYIAAASQVWAAGTYRQTSGGTQLGVLVQIDSTTSPPSSVTATKAFRGVSYRLAVGDSGVAYYHDGTKWVENTSLETILGGISRRGVWGTKLTSGEAFYLSGLTSSTSPAILACTASSGTFTCAKHTGPADGVLLGSVFGTLTSAGAQGPLWAARMGTSTAEDIFYSAGTGTTWATTSPQGCADGGSSGTTACSNTTGESLHLYASSSTDVWVTGSYGLLLHYDGSAWSKVSTGITGFSSYHLDAVYSSPSDSLVTLAARLPGTGNQIVLFNYNTSLKRWYGPIVVQPGAVTNLYDQIHDLGGKGYSNLWAVGTKRVGPTTNPRWTGWYLQLK